MKKKRFYNNKERGGKWTEPEVGYKIDFADKYANDSTATSKFDPKTPKKKKKHTSKENLVFSLKKAGIILSCVLILYIGYTIMDVIMDRNSMSPKGGYEDDAGVIGAITLEVESKMIDSLALDGAVMLDAVLDDTLQGGYTSVMFDLKRDDGTIGYTSSLATIDTIGAISSPARDLKASVSKLKSNDVLPIGRIVCYKDALLPLKDSASAIMQGNTVYTGSKGATYLNPDSQTVYNYLRGIIEEAAGCGVNVFVLFDTDLPEELSQKYRDGFEVLAQRLTDDLGNDLKFLYPVTAEIKSENADKIKKEIKEKLTKDLKKNGIFVISCTNDNKEEVKKQLDENGYTAYIMLE